MLQRIIERPELLAVDLATPPPDLGSAEPRKSQGKVVSSSRGERCGWATRWARDADGPTFDEGGQPQGEPQSFRPLDALSTWRQESEAAGQVSAQTCFGRDGAAGSSP